MTLAEAINLSQAPFLPNIRFADLQEASNTLTLAGYRTLASRCDEGILLRQKLAREESLRLRQKAQRANSKKLAISRHYS